MNDKLYNKKWLQEQVNSKPLRHIAKALDVPYSRVQSAIKKLDIKIPKRTKYFYTEESRREKSEMIKFRLWQKYPGGRYGELASNWRGGMPKCVDCGTTLSRKDAIRCKAHEGLQRKGGKNINWKGGIWTIDSINIIIRNTGQFKAWRKAVYERDKYICQNKKCGKNQLKDGVTIHADHIKPFALIIEENDIKSVKEALACEELWDLENGRVLCEDCHLATDTYGGGGKKRYLANLGT